MVGPIPVGEYPMGRRFFPRNRSRALRLTGGGNSTRDGLLIHGGGAGPTAGAPTGPVRRPWSAGCVVLDPVALAEFERFMQSERRTRSRLTVH